MATLALWALAGLSAGWWALKMASAVPGRALTFPPAVSHLSGPVDPVAIGRLLGAEPAPAPGLPAVPSLASRFVLMGVVAGMSGGGTVLLSVDGQPPKPYRVGSQVADGVVLQSVKGRRATLGPSLRGPAALTLELPPLAP